MNWGTGEYNSVHNTEQGGIKVADGINLLTLIKIGRLLWFKCLSPPNLMLKFQSQCGSQSRSRAFKKWLGNSFVDSWGNRLLSYHRSGMGDFIRGGRVTWATMLSTLNMWHPVLSQDFAESPPAGRPSPDVLSNLGKTSKRGSSLYQTK